MLHDELGRGGMATVQRAHDEVLDRTVAVKLLHEHLATDPAFLDRFRREARAAAALDHPNVVAVHDWGESEEGAYLVLQLIDGPSLREVLRTHGRLSPAATLAILGPAAAGLAAAHEAGLVHRDVKPENLLLGRDGGVRVTDFGLARAAASATATFGADVLVGSPHYLSPEAVQGQPLDPRADVYGLGVVLFECLTGRPPHEGESPFATAVAHTSRPVPPPSSIVPELDPRLDEVVQRATAIDREDRYPDAASFGRALSHAVPGGPRAVSGASGLPTALLGPPAPPDTRTRVVQADRDDTAIVDTDHPDLRGRSPFGAARRSSRIWLAVLVLAALIGGSGLGGYLLWDRVLAPMTPVPGVLGAPSDQAEQLLRDAGFDVALDPEHRHDLAVPAGHVLDQAPAGDARLGRTVTLVVSAGPRQLEVPDVVGDPAEEARDRIAAAGFEPSVAERHDDDVPRGAVIATDPAATEIRDEASQVELVVSAGPRPIDAPNLVGRSETEAAAVAEDLGLEVTVSDRRHDDAAEGTVLHQSPERGATLHRGDSLSIVVSRGPALVDVPNVRGMLLDEAVEELRSLGLEVEFEQRGGFWSFVNPGRVYEQDPGPGSVLPRGERVFLWAYED